MSASLPPSPWCQSILELIALKMSIFGFPKCFRRGVSKGLKGPQFRCWNTLEDLSPPLWASPSGLAGLFAWAKFWMVFKRFPQERSPFPFFNTTELQKMQTFNSFSSDVFPTQAKTLPTNPTAFYWEGKIYAHIYKNRLHFITPSAAKAFSEQLSNAC